MSVIEEVKQRVDIIELISRYVPVQKSGSSYKALCPFHDERTPSFAIFPQSGTWRCFGACGEGGDVFSFLMRRENIDFREALQILAEEVGVQLTEFNDGNSNQRSDLYEINTAAATYFQEILAHHPEAEEARRYIANRHIDSETVAQFQIGYALDSWDSLRNHLERLGFDSQSQVAAGLLKHNEERNSYYDAFRGRVIIPIRDRRGRTIGFGGRVLGDGQPKYLNISETALFHKSHVVFGLNLASDAIRQAEQVVIVEGYMDVIAAHQHGIENTVACMGTAITAEQLQQLQRLTDHFILALDADSAGQQATIRGLNQARQALTRTRKPKLMSTGRLSFEEKLNAQLSIVSLPEGRDPDDVIRQDPDEWRQLVHQAKPLVDFYFQLVSEQYDLASARGKAQAVSELAPLMAELNDEIEQQHYIQQLSRLIRVDESTISGRVQMASRTLSIPAQSERKTGRRPVGIGSKIERPASRSEVPSGTPDPFPPSEGSAFEVGRAAGFAPLGGNVQPSFTDASGQKNRVAKAQSSLTDPGDYLLSHLLQNPVLLIRLADLAAQNEVETLQCEELVDTENQEILRSLKNFITSDEQWDIGLFQDTMPPYLHGRLANLLTLSTQVPQFDEESLPEELLKLLFRLRIQQINEKNQQIRYLIQEAHSAGDADAVRKLQASHNSAIRDRSHLDALLGKQSRTRVMH
ncbi:MAG: DNA primase [Chloroflexota bacterium]